MMFSRLFPKSTFFLNSLYLLSMMLAGPGQVQAGEGRGNQFDDVVWSPSKTSLDEHVATSKVRVLNRLGVSAKVVDAAEKYFFDIKTGANRQSRNVAQNCVSKLGDSNHARDQFFLCVLDSSPNSLDGKFYSLIHQEKINRIQNITPNLEKEKSIALIAFLEDLVRERMQLQGQSSSWFSTSKGEFLQIEEFGDFPFEDGDVVLSMGTSWISSMITQSTFPQKKYSHAFMVRIDENGFRTMEAIIEKGVISNDFEYFKNEKLNGLLVLRWRNEGERKRIAKRAAEIAEQWVRDEVGYDIEMDVSDSSKLFCSELVLLAYAQAAGLDISELTPKFANIRSDKVFNLLKLVGVGKKEMPSPGDLMSSEKFEIVGSWRPQDRLLELWSMIFMADVFIERLELNYEVKPNLGYLAQWMMVGLDGIYGLANSIIGVDRNLIPDATSKSSLKYLVTIQKGIFDLGIKHGLKLAKKKSRIKEASLFSVTPWDLHGYISYNVQENSTVRNVLYDPANPPRSKKKRLRPPHRR